MPGSKDNVNLNYLLLLFLLFLTKWISQTVFLSLARQEPNCTFQPRPLAKSSSSAHSSFRFFLDLIIFQPGLLPAPMLKITLEGIYEQPREWLRCCKALLLCQLGCPLLFLDLISSPDKDPATDSAAPNFCKLVGALHIIFPLMFELSTQCGAHVNSGVVSEGFGSPGHPFSCMVSSAFAAVELPSKGWESSVLRSVHCPHHTRDWASFYSMWIFKMLRSHCISTGVNGKCMSSEVWEKITFLIGLHFKWIISPLIKYNDLGPQKRFKERQCFPFVSQVTLSWEK